MKTIIVALALFAVATPAFAGYEENRNCNYKKMDKLSCIVSNLSQSYVEDEKPFGHVLHRELPRVVDGKQKSCKYIIVKRATQGDFAIVKQRFGSKLPKMGAPIFTTNSNAFSEKGKGAYVDGNTRAKSKVLVLDTKLTAEEAASKFVTYCK